MNAGKILVTGADGFIGSHLTEKLIREGKSVRAFVLYNSLGSWGWLDNIADDVKKEIEIVQGDIRDSFGVTKAMSGCQKVLHLAALIAIPYSYHSPDTYIETNVKGTLNVLQAARQVGIERLIHTSTSEVYGTAQFVPMSENHPIRGQSPYSASKIGADQVAYSFYASFGLPVVTLRPFNTFGPRQSTRAVIPTIITQLLSKVTNLKIGSVAPTRDFSFVSDTVAAFALALDAINGVGEVVNIGSGFEVSVLEVISMIANILNVSFQFETEPERLRPTNSEVERLCCDNSKAWEIFGWSPKYAGREGLKRGLEETIEWFANANNLERYKPDIYTQ